MNADQYQLWKEHPQTKEFLQYLKDYRNVLMERWARGYLVGDDNIASIARARFADETINLDDEGMKQFYETYKGDDRAE